MYIYIYTVYPRKYPIRLTVFVIQKRLKDYRWNIVDKISDIYASQSIRIKEFIYIYIWMRREESEISSRVENRVRVESESGR